jgi:hypothetical protein
VRVIAVKKVKVEDSYRRKQWKWRKESERNIKGEQKTRKESKCKEKQERETEINECER